MYSTLVVYQSTVISVLLLQVHNVAMFQWECFASRLSWNQVGAPFEQVWLWTCDLCLRFDCELIVLGTRNLNFTSKSVICAWTEAKHARQLPGRAQRRPLAPAGSRSANNRPHPTWRRSTSRLSRRWVRSDSDPSESSLTLMCRACTIVDTRSHVNWPVIRYCYVIFYCYSYTPYEYILLYVWDESESENTVSRSITTRRFTVQYNTYVV